MPRYRKVFVDAQAQRGEHKNDEKQRHALDEAQDVHRLDHQKYRTTFTVGKPWSQTLPSYSTE